MADDEQEDTPKELQPHGNEEVEQKQEELDTLTVENGPFQCHTLIQNLPHELEYVCFEAYDNNIYLGTTTGDLLHYFEIEPRNYMLVSQTKFNPESSHQIDKILILPNIERALVLCNNNLVLFLLPEFAPAPNTTTFKGISDMAIRGYSEHSKSYKFYATQEDSIKLFKASLSGILLAKTYDFKLSDKLCAHGQILAVAKLNSYELLNLRNSSVVPLFRISETDAPLKPVITEFSKDEFLVATGGGSYQDSSIALIVNHNGDVVNGTIVLENFPSNVVVDYPYIIVNFGPQRVYIYRIGYEPKIVQRITTSSPLRIARISKIFSGFRKTETKDKVTDKLRKVSLIKGTSQLRIDNERAYIDEIFEEESSLAIYGNSGIYLLVRNSAVLDFTQHGESEIDAIESYLVENRKTDQTKFKQIENNYLSTMVLLLIILHCKTIDESIINRWCSASNFIDVRLLFYILGFQVYGEIWINNGLIKFVEKLKLLKLIHKCNHVTRLLQMINDALKKQSIKSLITDLDNVTKTIDVNMFKQQLKDDDQIDVNLFEENSLDEIIKLIEDSPDRYIDLLLKIYERRGMLQDSLNILKRRKDTRRMLKCLEQNLGKFSTSYTSEQLTDDLMYIINESSKVDSSLITELLNILSSAQVDPHKLISKLSDNTSVKVLIIEKLGADDTNEKQFLIDYYIAQLQETVQEKKLWELFGEFTSVYSKDMNYTKTSITEFFIIKLKNNDECKTFIKLYRNIKAICEKDEDSTLTKSIINQVKEFDIGHILTLLFLPHNDTASYLTKEELFEVFMASNDFLSIEKCLNQKNILEVLQHYVALSKIQGSVGLITQLIQRNLNCIKDEKILLSVLKELPVEFAFNTLFNVIFCIVKGLDSENKELELQKALLKGEIHIYNEIAGKFIEKGQKNL